MKYNKVLITDALRTVKKSKSRFISIIAIVALGVSFFCGMNSTAPDMANTMKQYIKDTNPMDIQILSTAGLTDSDISVISSINGVEYCEGEKFVDGICQVDGKRISDLDGSNVTVRAYPLNMEKVFAREGGVNDPTFLNRPLLVKGSWPTAQNQCLVDESVLSTPDEFQIGSVIKIEGDGTDVTSSLAETEFTIVGVIRTPLYISFDRGNTNIGTGKLASFIYLPKENFTAEYYTTANIKIQGSEGFDPYSKEYESFIAPYKSYLQSIAADLLNTRVGTLKEKYSLEVSKGEKEYAESKVQIETELADAKKQVDTILDLAQNGEQKLAQYKEEYNKAASQIDTNVSQSELQHSTQYAQWETKKKEYDEAEAKVKAHANAETEYSNALTEYNVTKNQVDTMYSTVSYLEDLCATTRAAMDHFNETQDSGVSSIIDRIESSGLVGPEVNDIINSFNSMTAMGTAEEMMAYMEPQLQTLEARLSSSKAELAAAKVTLAEKKAELDEAEKMIAQMKQLSAQLEISKKELDQAEKALTSAGYDIKMGELEAMSELSQKKNEITAFETSINMAKDKAKTIEAEFEAAKTKAYEELDNAKNRLFEAKNFLLALDNAKWYVKNRDEALLGFKAFSDAINRTEAISLIFPWFFFLVAALVCLNTMTRMVEEERVLLGTFTALGFTKTQIMGKYLIFAFIASFTGGLFGSVIGSVIFPEAISKAFGIIFDMPKIELSYHFMSGVLGIVISCLVTVGAAYYTSFKSLNVLPASLMRSKAPQKGKKILLEKFDFIWSKLNFAWKVTMRNVFRNMKRFVMATLGVAGCTALLVAAFGLDNSINSIIDRQFLNEDKIWNYDMQLVLNGAYDSTMGEVTALSKVRERSGIKSAVLEYMNVFDAISDKSSEKAQTYLLVPGEPESVGEYLNLRNPKNKKTEYLSDNGAIITEKLAQRLKIKVGDSIKIKISDEQSLSIPVAGIAENYVFYYIYMTPNLYRSVFGTNPLYNYIAANLAVDNMSASQKNELAQGLMDEYEISAVAYTSQIEESLSHTLDSISAVVAVIIISAGLLAFIVLYNLSIINITERIKEIATTKVLGFSDGEVSLYIFRENILLTLIGIAEGLILGIGLHKLIITAADIDTISYGQEIGFMSFIYAGVLAFAFSMLVSAVLHSRLKKVDMIESLKSIE